MSTRVAWVFYDASVPETWNLEVNPTDATEPTLEKNFTYQATAAQDGKVLAFQGRDAPSKITFSGNTILQSTLDNWRHWYAKIQPFNMTDDLGQTYSVVITKFDAKRRRSINLPNLHSYDGEILVMGPAT